MLVVEDEPLVRAISVEALETLGYRVLQASNGQEALEVARAYDGAIDVVVSDVVMPIMGGPALMQHLRLERPHMKVLFVSGYTDDAIVRQGVLEPGVEFLQKPFPLATLARRIRDILGAARRGHAQASVRRAGGGLKPRRTSGPRAVERALGLSSCGFDRSCRRRRRGRQRTAMIAGAAPVMSRAVWLSALLLFGFGAFAYGAVVAASASASGASDVGAHDGRRSASWRSVSPSIFWTPDMVDVGAEPGLVPREPRPAHRQPGAGRRTRPGFESVEADARLCVSRRRFSTTTSIGRSSSASDDGAAPASGLQRRGADSVAAMRLSVATPLATVASRSCDRAARSSVARRGAGATLDARRCCS